MDIVNLSAKSRVRIKAALDPNVENVGEMLQLLTEAEEKTVTRDVLLDLISALPLIHDDDRLVEGHYRSLLGLLLAIDGERFREVLDGRL